MKLICLFTAIAAMLVSTPVMAKECCDAMATKVKAGEACAKCAKDAPECCKAMAKTTVADAKKAGTKIKCTVCATAKKS